MAAGLDAEAALKRRLHVPAERIAAGQARLEAAEWHYLHHVLRLAPGASLEVFDGHGGVYQARLAAEGEALALGPRGEAAPPAALVWLAFAPPRGDRADLVVEKAVELGAARLLPVETARSVVRLDTLRGASRAERWRRIAAAAARQCGRADVPEVDEPAPLLRALSAAPPGFRTLLFHPGAEPFPGEGGAVPGYLAAVGPEGGFAPDEVAAAAAAGARVVSLGPRVLRAETAALAALALLQHRFGDLG